MITSTYHGQGETADTYIEGIVDKLKNVLTDVTVATSDLAEQQLVFNKGANRMSALDLMLELQRSKRARDKEAEYQKVQGYGRKKRGSLTKEQLDELGRLRESLSGRKYWNIHLYTILFKQASILINWCWLVFSILINKKLFIPIYDLSINHNLGWIDDLKRVSLLLYT